MYVQGSSVTAAEVVSLDCIRCIVAWCPEMPRQKYESLYHPKISVKRNKPANKVCELPLLSDQVCKY